MGWSRKKKATVPLRFNQLTDAEDGLSATTTTAAATAASASSTTDTVEEAPAAVAAAQQQHEEEQQQRRRRRRQAHFLQQRRHKHRDASLSRTSSTVVLGRRVALHDKPTWNITELLAAQIFVEQQGWDQDDDDDDDDDENTNTGISPSTRATEQTSNNNSKPQRRQLSSTERKPSPAATPRRTSSRRRTPVRTLVRKRAPPKTTADDEDEEEDAAFLYGGSLKKAVSMEVEPEQSQTVASLSSRSKKRRRCVVWEDETEEDSSQHQQQRDHASTDFSHSLEAPSANTTKGLKSSPSTEQPQPKQPPQQEEGSSTIEKTTNTRRVRPVLTTLRRVDPAPTTTQAWTLSYTQKTIEEELDEEDAAATTTWTIVAKRLDHFNMNIPAEDDDQNVSLQQSPAATCGTTNATTSSPRLPGVPTTTTIFIEDAAHLQTLWSPVPPDQHQRNTVSSKQEEQNATTSESSENKKQGSRGRSRKRASPDKKPNAIEETSEERTTVPQLNMVMSRCLEQGLLQARLEWRGSNVSQAAAETKPSAWFLSLALTSRAFQVCSPETLPLRRRRPRQRGIFASTLPNHTAPKSTWAFHTNNHKYQQADWIHDLVEGLCGVLSTEEQEGMNNAGTTLDTISARHVYEWTDNQQLAKLWAAAPTPPLASVAAAAAANENSTSLSNNTNTVASATLCKASPGLWDSSRVKVTDSPPLRYPRLNPTLRAYQACAVQWMLQREGKHGGMASPVGSGNNVGEEWRLAWVQLVPSNDPVATAASIEAIPLHRNVNKERRQMHSPCLLFCPLVGWLATSFAQARNYTMGERDAGSDNHMDTSESARVEGGILAESMGLGKSVEVLACIVAHPRPLATATINNQDPTCNTSDSSALQLNTTSQETVNVVNQSSSSAKKVAVMEVGDSADFVDSDDSSSEEEDRKPRAVVTTPKRSRRPSVPVTPDPKSDVEMDDSDMDNGSDDGKESNLTEEWVDSSDGLLGSCLCRTLIHLSDATKKKVVFCPECKEPMHFKCAGITEDESLPNVATRVRYRQMFSDLEAVCWVLNKDRLCPCCLYNTSNNTVSSRATLIVSPSAILNQWEREIERHTKDLKVTVYQGVDRICRDNKKSRHGLHPHWLADHDVVLMTFDSLMADFGHSDENTFLSGGEEAANRLRRRKRYRVVPSPLSTIEWWRVCLDEAQRVERPTATSAQMALKLHAVHRWCVTGTPIGRGKLEDLYGLLLFLRAHPFSSRQFFNVTLDPSHPDIAERIRCLLGNFFWRSTKSCPLVSEQMGVPEQEERKHFLTFSSIEKHFYDRQLEATLTAAGDFAERRRKGQGDSVKQISLLADHLHRLRAACCHPQVGAGGLGKKKKQAVASMETDLNSRVMTMEEILVRFIDDARLKCEESQRLAVMHTNAMASVTRLKVEAKQRGVGIKESDDKLLVRSCKLYMESLNVAESNSTPTLILGRTVMTGNVGFQKPNALLQRGTGLLEWIVRDIGETNSIWAQLDFDGNSRRITQLRVRPVEEVPPSMKLQSSSNDGIKALVPAQIVLQVSSTALGGEFIDVATITTPSVLQTEEWLVAKGFRTNKSKSWRVVLKGLGDCSQIPHNKESLYVGLKMEIFEADIASDSLQRLHCLHNAAQSFDQLAALREAAEDEKSGKTLEFMDLASMKSRSDSMKSEANEIESLYMQAAVSVHRECKRRLVVASTSRAEAENQLRKCWKESTQKTNKKDDCWDDCWWDDFLVYLNLFGDEQQRHLVCNRVHEDLERLQNGTERGLIKFRLAFRDVNGLRVALQTRIDNIRKGIGKATSWIGTVDNESPIYGFREDRFKCPRGTHKKCMETIASFSPSPSGKELYENSHCHVCKADWNQQGPKCRHCIIGDELIELECDRVTSLLLNTIHALLRGIAGSSPEGNIGHIAERANRFFEVLDMEKREKVAAWRFWRTHLDLMNDCDELNQSKSSMRLTFEGEDITSLTEDQLNAVVIPSDAAARFHDHAAKQAMTLGELRRAKDTLRFLRNQRAECNDAKEADDEPENCIVCLSPFESERGVLRCGHSFHRSCIEKLTSGRLITCPLRCRVPTNTDEVITAVPTAKRHDDGSRSKRDITGSWGTKVSQVVSDLLDIRDMGEKAILFSQWEDMLDIVGEALAKNEVNGVRVKSMRKIGESLAKFRAPSSTVLMLNVKNGAEGLTILEATHVLIVEPLMNHALDSQAINRVCRVGQHRRTIVHRYLVNSTVEMKIDALRMENQDGAIEDTMAVKSVVRAGGIDGGFSNEDDLMDLLTPIDNPGGKTQHS